MTTTEPIAAPHGGGAADAATPLDLGFAPALIVVDAQNAYCHREGFIARSGLDHRAVAIATAKVVELVEAARERGLPIVFTRNTIAPDYRDAGLAVEVHPEMRTLGALVAGTWDHALVPELQPREGELVLDKPRSSSFFATPLARWLHARGVDVTIVCGFTTNMCVEATVRDAFSHDFRSVVPDDATASVTEAYHQAGLANLRFLATAIAPAREIAGAILAHPRPTTTTDPGATMERPTVTAVPGDAGDPAMMTEAIELARTWLEEGRGRYCAAIVVKDGEIVGRGTNTVDTTHDPTAHCEVNAIRDATSRLGTADLSGCDLYVTFEPCSLCVAAIWWSRVDRVFYGASFCDGDPRFRLDAHDGLREEIAHPPHDRRRPYRSLQGAEAMRMFEEWWDRDNPQPHW